MNQNSRLILLTGATGYVGGRLLTLLLEHGYRVRCLTRNPKRLSNYELNNLEITEGDLLDIDSLHGSLIGVDTAFYLVHSMGSKQNFEQTDRKAAENFATAARMAGVKRIIYLGGLGDPDQDLSTHLKSRQEVGRILRESGVETIELRASIVIGSGSLSFEMVRALVERIPWMIMPKWVSVPAQPIFINDLLAYLLESVTLGGSGSRIYEIGGADVVSYSDIMREYARQRGLKRLMIPVPVLTPYLSSLWLGLVTPVYARIGRKLIDSIRNPTVVQSDKARTDFSVEPVGVGEAINSALRNEDHSFAQTRWSDALSSGGDPQDWGGVRFGSRIVDSRTEQVELSPELAFAPIERIGGATGWYYGHFLWRIRGFLDLIIGGVGLRRGRRDPDRLIVGDTVDFWRVEAIEPNRLLRLSAEMKLPGRAWLQFEVEPSNNGSIIRQTAMFDPYGLPGLLYWYSLYPLHEFVFAGMLRNIARAGKNLQLAEAEMEPTA